MAMASPPKAMSSDKSLASVLPSIAPAKASVRRTDRSMSVVNAAVVVFTVNIML